MLAPEEEDEGLAGVARPGDEPQDPQMKLARAIQTLDVERVLELLTSDTVDVNKSDSRG